MKMKRFKTLLKSQTGFTLAELVIAMTIGSLVVTAAVAIMAQMLWVVPRNTSYAAAFTQVQNAASWISHDGLMAQQVYQMAEATLTSDVDPGDDEIPVDSVEGFPPSGVICIEDEFIQYTGIDYEDKEFTGCIWESNAKDPDGLKAVTFFITLNWTVGRKDVDTGEMIFEQYQTVYTLAGSSGELGKQKELWRNRYIWDTVGGTFVLQDTTRVAECIDQENTSSIWDDNSNELVVTITAQVGEKNATRTYRTSPRPLS